MVHGVSAGDAMQCLYAGDDTGGVVALEVELCVGSCVRTVWFVRR